MAHVNARPLLIGSGVGVGGFAMGLLIAWAALPAMAHAADPDIGPVQPPQDRRGQPVRGRPVARLSRAGGVQRLLQRAAAVEHGG